MVLITLLVPCTQFSWSVVPFSNKGPEVIKKLAYFPLSSDPTLSLIWSIRAGSVVNASKAFVLSRPYLIATKRSLVKSFGFLDLKVVRAKGTALSCNAFGFVGAWFQARMSSRDR